MKDTSFKEKISRYLLGDMKFSERKKFITEMKKTPENRAILHEYLMMHDLLQETLKRDKTETE